MPGLRLLGRGDPRDRVSVFSFSLEGVPPAEIVRQADREGIALRASDLAALPLLRRLGTAAAARASAYLYNSTEEMDRLGETLERIAAS